MRRADQIAEQARAIEELGYDYAHHGGARLLPRPLFERVYFSSGGSWGDDKTEADVDHYSSSLIPSGCLRRNKQQL